MRRAALLVVAVAGLLSIGLPAQAHNYLVSSTPAAGSTLTALPAQFDIVTNEDMLVLDGGTGGFAFQITDAAGLHYETGCVAVAGATMSMEPRLGAAGTYTARWQVVSADGHSISDAFTFEWVPADESEVSVGLPEAPACGDPLGEPSSTPSATPASAPPFDEPEVDRNATVPLSDVLWIGGALLAFGVAVLITILVLSRRRRPSGE